MTSRQAARFASWVTCVIVLGWIFEETIHHGLTRGALMGACAFAGLLTGGLIARRRG